MAIGNHSRIRSPNSPASITQNLQSVTARTEVGYGSVLARSTNAWVAPA